MLEGVLERVTYLDVVISDLIGVEGLFCFFILGLAVALRLVIAIVGAVSVAGSSCSDSPGVELFFE
jgi:hypothetical protein